MTKMQAWLLTVGEEKIIDEILKLGCPWCPAIDYCEESPLRCCKEILHSWAKEDAGDGSGTDGDCASA